MHKKTAAFIGIFMVIFFLATMPGIAVSQSILAQVPIWMTDNNVGFLYCDEGILSLNKVSEHIGMAACVLTETSTPRPTATNTLTPTSTIAPTSTLTPMPTSTNTSIPTATSTRTPLPTLTKTPVPSSTATPISTRTPTPTPVSGISLNDRHPDAGVWMAYRGNNTVSDINKPHIKGAMAYAKWYQLQPTQDTFDWRTLDNELDIVVNKAGKKAFVIVTAGYCPGLPYPEWIGNTVAKRVQLNENGCRPYQFYDPVYTNLYKDFITNLANHLAEFDSTDARPNATDILFVRASVMAKTMENLPDSEELTAWEAQDFTPAANGNLYQINLTQSIKFDYQTEIISWYASELRRAYAAKGLEPPTPAGKGSTYWNPFPNLAQLMNIGMWLDQHSANPNPQNFYYDTYLMTKASNTTRGTSEAGGRTEPSTFASHNYWEILATMHSGVEFIAIYGKNAWDGALQPKGAIGFTENLEALLFADKYAGHYRNPSKSPGAWIALRGSYPTDRWSPKFYMRRIWTNYEFLITQLNPQDSKLLYGVSESEYSPYAINPRVDRATKQPWTDEMQICLSTWTQDLCNYLYQQPDLYIGVFNNKHRYSYTPTDLGQLTFCGTDTFCTNGGTPTRTEKMYWARSTNRATGSPYINFDVNNQFGASIIGQTTIRVVYLDVGNDSWQLLYKDVNGTQKSAGVIVKQNTNVWKEAFFTVSGASYSNLDGDIALYDMGDGDDIFHMIEILKEQ